MKLPIDALDFCLLQARRSRPKLWMIVRSSATLPAIIAMSLGMGAQASVNPLEVNALIREAVETHPLVGAAIADEKAATEGVTAAKLGLLPTPSVNAQHDRERGMTTQFAIRQPLWTGGRLTATVNQAVFDEKAATAHIFEQQNTVAKNTIDIWQSYIYAIALQELHLKNLERLAEFEAMMQRRVDQGVSARIELDLVTNRIFQDQNAFQGAKEQQRIAEARLEQMIGQPVSPPNAKVPMSLLVQYAKEQSAPFGQLAFGDVSQTNPSVIRQKFQVEAARQEHLVQRASRYPNVYAQYTHTFYLEEDKNSGDFSVGMSYDPGAGFSNLALARASQARVQSLTQSQEAARRTVMEDIQTAYQRFVSARDKETSLIAAVAGARIVVNSYRRQFIAGRKSWLEVLNAVREEGQYEQQLLEVQAQMVASFYKLQVDFGMMPWQQANNDRMLAPVTKFAPFVELADWVKARQAEGFGIIAGRPDSFEDELDEYGRLPDGSYPVSNQAVMLPPSPAKPATNFNLVLTPMTSTGAP